MYKGLKSYDKVVYYIIIMALVGSLVGYILHEVKKNAMEKYSIMLDISAYVGIVALILVIFYGVNFYMKKDKAMKMKQEEELNRR